jgi:hypothetical protein
MVSSLGTGIRVAPVGLLSAFPALFREASRSQTVSRSTGMAC